MSVRVMAGVLADAVETLFVGAGLSKNAAGIVAADLVAADIEGVTSHGVSLVPLYMKRIQNGSVTLAERGEVISRNAGAIVLDGRHALGQLTGRQAVAEAVAAAREHGLAAVALRNAFHLGALNLYTRLMADENCIGIVTTNTRPLLPAPGGAEAVTGNNPLAISAPSSGEYHAEVDMALSAVAMGKIRNAATAGQKIPHSWATDASGMPTTDPNAAIAGMLLPAAGPKGFGLAFLLDLLAGGLSEGNIGPEVQGLYGDPRIAYGCAAFVLAIHVGHFCDPTRFGTRANAALERISTSVKAPGTERVFAPGELAFAARSGANGTCAIAPATLAALNEAGHALNINLNLT